MGDIVSESTGDFISVRLGDFVGIRIDVASISVAHLDGAFKYPGKGDYRGIFVETDLTQEASKRGAEVLTWITDAKALLQKAREPAARTGAHCSAPSCGFYDHCKAKEPKVRFPIEWLPRVQSKALRQHIIGNKVADLSKVPDELLNERQKRVKDATVSGMIYFDRKGAAADLARYKLPGYFLDFETISFAVPIWQRTRPYQQIPFQFNLHRLSRDQQLTHSAFLDTTGKDPSRRLAEALVSACGKRGPIFVYNSAFEETRINEIADRFRTLRAPLLAIARRIVDLRPIAEAHFYDPEQRGSWSIKRLLPAINPASSYEALDSIQDGNMAMAAYVEAISHGVPPARKKTIESQLLDYCRLDTYALTRIWKHLSGTKTQKGDDGHAE